MNSFCLKTCALKIHDTTVRLLTDKRALGAAALAAAFFCAPVLSAEGARPWYGAVGASFNTGSGVTAYSEFDSNWRSVNVSVGRNLTSKTRLQLWVSESQNDFVTSYVYSRYTQEFRNRRRVASLDAYRSMWGQGKLSVHVGIGVGLEWITSKQRFEDQLFAVSEASFSYRELQYNVTGGVSYQINPRFSVQSNYRLSRTTGGESDQDSQTVSVSLSIHIGKPRNS